MRRLRNRDRRLPYRKMKYLIAYALFVSALIYGIVGMSEEIKTNLTTHSNVLSR